MEMTQTIGVEGPGHYCAIIIRNRSSVLVNAPAGKIAEGEGGIIHGQG